VIENGASTVVGIVAGLGSLLAVLALCLVGRLVASPPPRARRRQAQQQQPRDPNPSRDGHPNRPLVGWAQRPTAHPVSAGAQLNLAGVAVAGPVFRVATSVREAAPAAVAIARPVVRRTPIVIHPVDRPYWDLQHWELVGNRLTGFYRTPYGSYAGYILDPQAPRPQFFIVHPPEELQQHPHRACFHPVGAGTFSIHFGIAPTNPDAGILEVEKVLGEALSR